MTSVPFYRTYFNKIGQTINEDLDREEILLSALRERQGKNTCELSGLLEGRQGQEGYGRRPCGEEEGLVRSLANKLSFCRWFVHSLGRKPSGYLNFEQQS